MSFLRQIISSSLRTANWGPLFKSVQNAANRSSIAAPSTYFDFKRKMFSTFYHIPLQPLNLCSALSPLLPSLVLRYKLALLSSKVMITFIFIHKPSGAPQLICNRLVLLQNGPCRKGRERRPNLLSVVSKD